MHGKNVLEMRRERIDRVLAILTCAGRIEYQRAIALICYEMGVRTDTAKEYVNIHIKLGKLRRFEDMRNEEMYIEPETG